MLVYHLDFAAHGFGFMLSIGLFSFLPFLYTYTTRFLYLHPAEGVSHPIYLAFICLVEGNQPTPLYSYNLQQINHFQSINFI